MSLISSPCECCGRRWAPKTRDESRYCAGCKPKNIDRPLTKHLMQAVASAFELTAIRSFLTSMEMRGARIRVIEEASLDLTRYLDQPLETSFIVLFDSLEDEVRYEVFDFYAGNIDSVDRELKKEFPKVFRQ
jgi:hypothetical protein